MRRCVSLLCAICGIIAFRTGLACAQQQNTDALAEILRQYFERDLPEQPAFPDPIGLDSDNAAARFIALAKTFDPVLRRQAGIGDLKDGTFCASSFDDPPIPTQEYTELLQRNQIWLEQAITAANLPRFDRHLLRETPAASISKSDPRRDVLSFVRQASRALHDDALRLQADGQSDKAAARIAAVFSISRQLERSPLTRSACTAHGRVAPGENMG